LVQNKKIIISKTGVHDEKALAEFMARKKSIRESFDFVQWREFLFEDYSANESIFVLKMHHSVADQTALMLLFFNLQDFATTKDMPKLTSRISFC
jgi:hypothetical protein